MTNADYIKKQLTRLSDRELAAIVYEYFGIKTSGGERPKILKTAWRAFDNVTLLQRQKVRIGITYLYIVFYIVFHFILCLDLHGNYQSFLLFM